VTIRKGDGLSQTAKNAECSRRRGLSFEGAAARAQEARTRIAALRREHSSTDTEERGEERKGKGKEGRNSASHRRRSIQKEKKQKIIPFQTLLPSHQTMK
jgi:hypothetical protein